MTIAAKQEQVSFIGNLLLEDDPDDIKVVQVAKENNTIKNATSSNVKVYDQPDIPFFRVNQENKGNNILDQSKKLKAILGIVPVDIKSRSNFAAFVVMTTF